MRPASRSLTGDVSPARRRRCSNNSTGGTRSLAVTAPQIPPLSTALISGLGRRVGRIVLRVGWRIFSRIFLFFFFFFLPANVVLPWRGFGWMDGWRRWEKGGGQERLSTRPLSAGIFGASEAAGNNAPLRAVVCVCVCVLGGGVLEKHVSTGIFSFSASPTSVQSRVAAEEPPQIWTAQCERGLFQDLFIPA